MKARSIPMSALIISVLAISGCSRSDAPALTQNAASSDFKISASIQDLMLHEIEPAAEALWNSVSITVTEDGAEQKQPRTDEEWFELRGHAITLMEAANLLVMPGRKALNPGQVMADEGVQGVLPATEVQAKIDANHAQFVQFAHVLHDVSETMLQAIDAKNVQGIMDAGEAIDAACESCHLTFWYPNQVIPEFPN